MKVIEPGHIYDLHSLDGDGKPVRLTFVNREPGTEHPGTQTQECLRALIDRTIHCDNCLRWPGNDLIVYHLRAALALHEARAIERKVEKGELKPEKIAISQDDGHFYLYNGESDPNAAEEQEHEDKLTPRLPTPSHGG